jgi:hypothetical protein
MLAERELISTETDPVDGTEGAGVDLPMEVAMVPAVVVQRIFAGVVPDWQTGYWWQVVAVVKVAVTIPAAVVAVAVVITVAVVVEPGYHPAAATVHEPGTPEARARGAAAVMQVMDVLPGTTTLVVMVVKVVGPQAALGLEATAATVAVVENKTAVVPEVIRAENVMRTI